ncbi:hypothetical protein GCM10010191_05830 [Actinomadura vinacea]|uniref:Tetratricopeptide repeat protein n=1 Tax=Actinomadura vinacea TaxID=115336 RepID=A0ABN3ID33_9ACTN
MDDSARWPDCARLLAHVLAVQGNYRGLSRGYPVTGRAEAVFGELFHRAGRYLVERSGYREAREPVETALELRERVHGRRSPQWAETKLCHAALLYRLAELGAARTAVETAQGVREEIAGPEDPGLHAFLMWRCRILVEFSELAQAQRAAERAHRLLVAAGVPEGDHRRIEADDLRVTVLWRRGAFRAALRLMERGVAVQRESRGDADDRTLVALGRMAYIEQEMGAVLGDRALLCRARDRLVEVGAVLAARYSEEHFEVMEQRRALGAALCGLGDFAAAARLLAPVVAAYREALGDHPSTVAAERVYAVALFHEGEAARADALMLAGCALYESLYGPDHPYAAEILADHGALLAARGEAAEAAGALHRSRRIYEERYGPEHPKLVQILLDLAALPGLPVDEAAAMRGRAERIRARI